MDEGDWIAAMRADPADASVMGAFADWLDERGDPRAGLFRMLWELGKTGDDAPDRLNGYWSVGNGTRPLRSLVSGGLFNFRCRKYSSTRLGDTVDERMMMAESWAEVPERTREKWRTETAAITPKEA